MQAKGFCLVAAAHSSGCSRANRVARLPVFVFSLVFYGFHTSLFKLCTEQTVQQCFTTLTFRCHMQAKPCVRTVKTGSLKYAFCKI